MRRPSARASRIEPPKIPTLTGDQRRVARHTCCTEMQLVYEGFPRQIAVRIPDISPQGMFINTPQAFAEGSSVKVRFRLGHSGRLVHARGEVRYCLPGVGIGIEFVDIRPDDRAAIAEEGCNRAPEW
ncbi:MAG: PilZ domain-containing protein [Terriglobales bacterium]